MRICGDEEAREQSWRLVGAATGTRLSYEPLDPNGTPEELSAGQPEVFYDNGPFVFVRRADARGFDDVVLDCAGPLDGWKPMGPERYGVGAAAGSYMSSQWHVARRSMAYLRRGMASVLVVGRSAGARAGLEHRDAAVGPAVE